MYPSNGSNASNKWPSATRDHPCPKCGKPNRCRIAPDGGAGICWRSGNGESWRTPGAHGNGHARHTSAPPHAARPPRTYASADEAIAHARPAGMTLTGVYAYPGDALRLARFDPPDGGKTCRPVHRAGSSWRIGDPPGSLPLYRGDELPASGPIYIVEGEKCADIARSIGLAAVTSAHGSSSAAKSDWSPLAGRDCIILPDCDASGEKYAAAVTAILSALTPAAASVKIIRLPGLGDGEDIEQYLAAGGTREDIERLAAETVESPKPESLPTWPDPLGEDAFHGLAGEIVRAIEPHTEADPAALLIQFLIGFGNVAGRNCYFDADGARHYPNLFAVMVGRSSKGRKGTSWAQIRRPFTSASPTWADNRIVEGLASGEGLIWAVRDPIEKQEPIKHKGAITGYQAVQTDPGIEDKRLLVQEGEFAQCLKVLQREGNTLSPVIRRAWDNGGKLSTLTKNSPATATEAHISIIGHITLNELRARLDDTEAFNGFANRFLWVCAGRSKLLPDGGQIQTVDFSEMVRRLTDAIQFASESHFVPRDGPAGKLWHEVYADLSDERPGIFGAVTARAEAQVMRLAMVYAMLDCSAWVKVEHLRAALAVWDYCEASARFIFAGGEHRPADPLDDLIDIIRANGGTITARELVQKRRRYRNDPGRAERELDLLAQQGRGRWETSRQNPAGGRQSRIFHLLNGDEKSPGQSVNTSTVNDTPAGDNKNEGFVDVDTVATPANENRTAIAPSQKLDHRGPDGPVISAADHRAVDELFSEADGMIDSLPPIKKARHE